MKHSVAWCVLVAMLLLLAGCNQTQETPTESTTTPTTSVSTTAPTTLPPTTKPTQPPKATGAYFTELDVNFSDIFVTKVAVSYEADAIKLTYTVDDNAYQATYDLQGKLIFKRMESPDGYWQEENWTYTEKNAEVPLSYVFTRDGFTSRTDATFDDSGNPLTLAYTSDDGSWNTYTYTYDQNGKQLTEAYVSSGGSDTRQEYTYDDAGNWVQLAKYSKGTLIQTNVRTFNDGGYLVLEEVYTGEPTNPLALDQKTVFTVDEKGNVLKEEMTTARKDWIRTESTYDADGNVLTQNYSDSYGTSSNIVRTYTEAGQLMTSVEQWNGETVTFTYEYDAAGNQTKATVTYADGTVQQTVRTFDEKGKLLSFVSTDVDGNVEKEERTYDEHGNLLTYTTYRGEEVSTSCTYTYGYAQILPEQLPQLEKLMKTVFVEFIPAEYE